MSVPWQYIPLFHRITGNSSQAGIDCPMPSFHHWLRRPRLIRSATPQLRSWNTDYTNHQGALQVIKSHWNGSPNPSKVQSRPPLRHKYPRPQRKHLWGTLYLKYHRRPAAIQPFRPANSQSSTPPLQRSWERGEPPSTGYNSDIFWRVWGAENCHVLPNNR